MRLSLTTLAYAAGLALGLALPSGGASAAPLGPLPALDAPSQQRGLLQLVQGGEGEGAGAFSPRRQWEGQGGWRGGAWHGRDRYQDRRWRHHRRSGPSIYFEYAPMPYIYAPPPRYQVPRRHIHRLSAAHVAWCQARYRSYRAWDNTFQPNRGPRRICVSPYYY